MRKNYNEKFQNTGEIIDVIVTCIDIYRIGKKHDYF